jgi:hypothetical protein
MSKHFVPQFWPLDYDPEDEIYESVSWDLPGFRPDPKDRPKSRKESRKRIRQ